MRTEPPTHSLLPAWPIAAVGAIVVARATVIGVALATGQWAVPTRVFPTWFTLWIVILFGVVAALLIGGGRSDRRAWPLGVYCLSVASAVGESLVLGFPGTSSFVLFALSIRVDAFHAATVWFFANEFPTAAAQSWLRRALAAGFYAACFLGLLLLGLDLGRRTIDPGSFPLLLLSQALDRHAKGGDWFFTLQYASMLPLFFLVPLKIGGAGPDARRRLGYLAAGFGFAIVSVFLESALVSLVPSYRSMTASGFGRAARLGIILCGLSSLPLLALYAALVQRTLGVRLLLRAAVQYALARTVVSGVAMAPALGLIWLVYVNRNQPVVELFTGSAGVTLATVSVFGVVIGMYRRPVLERIDRTFFHEVLDIRETLLSLVNAMRNASGLEEFSALLDAAVSRAFHPSTMVLAFADTNGLLRAQNHDVIPLARTSALGQLVGGSDEPFNVASVSGDFLNRLIEADRIWLARTGALVVVPMRGPDSQLLGVLTLGERKGEVPYAEDDRSLLAAIGSACGLALARLRSIETLTRMSESTPQAEPPARECVECGLVYAGEATGCRCGAPLQQAPVPRQLADRLLFVRRIGAGAMGVVYEATDLKLRQPRAVKALPHADDAAVGPLRREARIMAATQHSHLALLFGLETWRGLPLLVMEYCDAGTLSDRIGRGPLPPDEVLWLGLRIGAALEHLHQHGILHRDVKPSNIGFANGRDPKLLDFGLAKLTDGLQNRLDGASMGDSTGTRSDVLASVGVRGTPAYLSPDVLGGAAPSAGDDVWSLCVTLLEACTGTNPFKAATPAASAARVLANDGLLGRSMGGVPPALTRVFSSTLAHGTRAGRESAREFVHQLTRAQGVTNGFDSKTEGRTDR